MFDGIILGQYIPGNSFIYKINPLNKIVFCIIMMITLLLLDTLLNTLLFGCFIIALFFICKLPLISVFKGMKSILFFLLITFFMHIFLSENGEILFEFYFLKITDIGLSNAFMIFLRLLFIIMLNSLLTLTTFPTEIAWGIEKLLFPLKIFKFPIEDFALMLSLSLRFIPVLFLELGKIIDAQKSRGAEFDSGSFIKRIFSFPPVLIPLFINSFFRAEEIAVAMEARCYNGSKNRTHFNIIGYGFLDTIFVFSYILFIFVFYYFRIL